LDNNVARIIFQVFVADADLKFVTEASENFNKRINSKMSDGFEQKMERPTFANRQPELH